MTEGSEAKPVRRRTAARLAGVQALYEMDVTGAEPDPVLREFMTARWARTQDGDELPSPDRVFFERLVRGVGEMLPQLDDAIAGALTPGWTLDRLEVLVRVLLRAGAFELKAVPDVPAKVVINEYMDVAHAFFEGSEPALINGVLDRLARDFRPDSRAATANDRRSRAG